MKLASQQELVDMMSVSPINKSNQIQPTQQLHKSKTFKIQDEIYDPYKNLSHFERVKVENELANQSITPFNSVDYV